jgi:hypothetical protein
VPIAAGGNMLEEWRRWFERDRLGTNKNNKIESRTSSFEMWPILAYPVGLVSTYIWLRDVVIDAMVSDDATVSLQPQSSGANTRVPAHAAFIQYIVRSAVPQ